jgi:Rrf2 family protein
MLRISEAAALALHAAALLATEPDEQRSTGEMARSLQVSEAHLSKVLQRLGRHGLVRSSRGPRGGWVMNADPEKVTLLQVYEAVEGPLAPSSCLLEGRRCSGQSCILGGLLEVVNRQVIDYLSNTRLASLACSYLPFELAVT